MENITNHALYEKTKNIEKQININKFDWLIVLKWWSVSPYKQSVYRMHQLEFFDKVHQKSLGMKPKRFHKNPETINSIRN